MVGTTSDYIQWIRKAGPDRALFLTEPKIRLQATEESPSGEEEILWPVNDIAGVKNVLTHHLDQWGQKIIGVACFDCESMETAAMLADDLSLDYPSVAAIRNSRDKYVSKQIWQKNGIACPRSKPVNSLENILEFLETTKSGLVLKPFVGSGSELVFKCTTPKECEHGFQIILQGLAERSSRPLFKKTSQDHLMLAEELILGIEFSCDFIVENGMASIIRMTRKINANHQSFGSRLAFGSILGYVIPGSLPLGTDFQGLEQTLFKGADSLGIHRGICMVDFMVQESMPVLIEMTPRPGGDCLPFLLLEAGNLDILKLALDFAEKKPGILKEKPEFSPHIGIRILAPKSGVLKKIDPGRLSLEPGIKQIHFIRKPGHVITLPPEDYDSWLLGHYIVQTDQEIYSEEQSLLLARGLTLEIESHD